MTDIPICPRCKLPAHAAESDDENVHAACQLRATAESITDAQMEALAGPPRFARYSVALLASIYNQIWFGDKP